MAFEAGSVIEMQIHYRVAGQQCMNIWHYEPGASFPGTVWDSEKAVADQVVADFPVAGTMPQKFLALLATNATVNRIQVQQIYENRFRAYYADVTIAGTWGGGGLATTGNVQASVQKFGINGTRHDIGAIHVGALPEDAYSNGLLTVPYQNALQEFADLWKQDYAFGGVGGGSIVPVILKKKKVTIDGKDKWEIDGATQLFGVDIKDEVRVMRRRTVGLGI